MVERREDGGSGGRSKGCKTSNGVARDPGSLMVAEVAAHWRVTSPTARAILKAAEAEPIPAPGHARYRWRDIWKIEGEGFVPPPLWADYKRPLLHPRDLASPGEYGGSARTARRDRQAGHLPQVVLSPSVRRVRPQVFEAWRERQGQRAGEA